MAKKLKNVHLTSVDLVRRGANQEADICLFKSLDGAPDEEHHETPREDLRTVSKSDPSRYDMIEEVFP